MIQCLCTVIKKYINEREYEGTTRKHGEIVTVDENVASDPLSKEKRRSSHRSIPRKQMRTVSSRLRIECNSSSVSEFSILLLSHHSLLTLTIFSAGDEQ